MTWSHGIPSAHYESNIEREAKPGTRSTPPGGRRVDLADLPHSHQDWILGLANICFFDLTKPGDQWYVNDRTQGVYLTILLRNSDNTAHIPIRSGETSRDFYIPLITTTNPSLCPFHLP